jgi:drug/metabolite transporter (DMT)-like permease
MTGVGLLWWSWQLIGDSYAAWTVAFLVAANIWGLGTVVAALLPDNRWTTDRVFTNRLAWATASLTASLFVVWAAVNLSNGLQYGTDAIAFNQYAAQLVAHGVNPYTHSMRPAYQLFGTPTSYHSE